MQHTNRFLLLAYVLCITTSLQSMEQAEQPVIAGPQPRHYTQQRETWYNQCAYYPPHPQAPYNQQALPYYPMALPQAQPASSTDQTDAITTVLLQQNSLLSKLLTTNAALNQNLYNLTQQLEYLCHANRANKNVTNDLRSAIILLTKRIEESTTQEKDVGNE